MNDVFMMRFLYIVILALFLLSCKERNLRKIVNEIDCKFDNGISYTVVYPENIYKDSINYLEVNNYKSSFDSINNNRIPMVYLMIEDDIVTEDIFKLKKDNVIAYIEYFIDGDSKFQIPEKLLDHKNGLKKITIAIMDVHIKEDLQKIDINNDDENIRMGYIEARSAFNISIQ